MPRNSKRVPPKLDPASESFAAGQAMVRSHPLFAPLTYWTGMRRPGALCPDRGWAVVTSAGSIHVHGTRRATPEEWAYVLAHCAFHLGFEHFRPHEHPREWNAACDCFLARFMANLKFGRPPEGFGYEEALPGNTEERLYEAILERGLPGDYVPDMAFEAAHRWMGHHDWPDLLATGLADAAESAMRVAGGVDPHLGATRSSRSNAQRARDWFISSYPLLGALAATLRLVEDRAICQRLDIGVGAVDDQTQEIFINPLANLDEEQARFVVAHEILHVGLRHAARAAGRDHLLWNVACDYVINGWLLEMHIGDPPATGFLYDPELKRLSAEAIYERIATDLRRIRKLATLRGVGMGDMLERGAPDWWAHGAGADLDTFYRDCLARGLDYQAETGRGYLPGAMIEEIRALSQRPIPWDVELARWFDHLFPPQDKVRSFARPSRRQSATPDIPRPSHVVPEALDKARTYGVVLDTSGSMARAALGKALGAIASYSLAHDVPLARVVFCDAAPYDQGYLPPEAIAGRVHVRGRGGTILQPAIDLLEKAPDFPPDGPILIITDGHCDRLHVHREHAFLMPESGRLPFVARGPIFRIRERD